MCSGEIHDKEELKYIENKKVKRKNIKLDKTNKFLKGVANFDTPLNINLQKLNI